MLSFYSVHGEEQKWYLLEFLCCQLEHQTNVGHSGSIHSDPCELSSEIAQSVWGW